MAVEQHWPATMRQNENDYSRARSACRSSSSGSGSSVGFAHRATGFERESTSCSSGSSVESKNMCCRGCVMACLVVLAAASAVCAGMALYLDNFAGVSESRDFSQKLYPRLDNAYMRIVVFNDSIPNSVGTYHKYVDLRRSVDSRTMSVRKGVLSRCERPLATPASVRFIESPWSPRTCTPDGINTFFCPVVAMRLGPGPPEVIVGVNENDGCYSRKQRCDGILNCPSGHDEMGCTNLPISCPLGSTQCPGKSVCIKDSSLCNGINDCGMYEDEADCCSIDGYIRCNDGHCVPGGRCDGVAECVDLSDEYNCPSPGDPTYFQCDDGQLIEARHVCDASLGMLQPYQCSDLSDETRCGNTAVPNVPASETASFDYEAGCFVHRHSWLPATAADSDGDDPSNAGSDRRRLLRASGSSYDSSAVVALLAATCGTAAIGSCLACLLIVLRVCWTTCCRKLGQEWRRQRRRRLHTAARLLAAAAAVLFLCAAAQAAVVVYWCLYVGDVNRELFRPGGGSKQQQSAVGQAFRETLLALGVEFRFRSSFIMTAAGSAAHLVCVVLCLIARRHLLLVYRRRSYLDSGGSASDGEELGSLRKYDIAAATAAKQPCVQLDFKVPMPDTGDDLCGTIDKNDGDGNSCEDFEKKMIPDTERSEAGVDDDSSADSWVADPDTRKLAASALDSATNLMAAPNGDGCCERDAATDVPALQSLLLGGAATSAMTTAPRKSPLQMLPCVRESESEDAVDDDYVNATHRRSSDAATDGEESGHDGVSGGDCGSLSAGQ